MSYKEIELPEELRKSLQEIFEVSGSGPRTLGISPATIREW
jgi:hypothetical protein